MNNTMTTTKGFWAIVTVGLWLILGILTITKIIDLEAFIGALTTTGMAAFGMYQMYNRKEAEDIIERQAEMINRQFNEIHKFNIDNTKLQYRIKILDSKLNESKTNEETKPKTKPQTKAKKSNKKVGK